MNLQVFLFVAFFIASVMAEETPQLTCNSFQSVAQDIEPNVKAVAPEVCAEPPFENAQDPKGENKEWLYRNYYHRGWVGFGFANPFGFGNGFGYGR
jgi:hypothetical protein